MHVCMCVCVYVCVKNKQSFDCFLQFFVKLIGRTPLTSVLNMTQNLVRLQSWSVGECGVLVHCSLVHSNLEWYHLIGSYLWFK